LGRAIKDRVMLFVQLHYSRPGSPDRRWHIMLSFTEPVHHGIPTVRTKASCAAKRLAKIYNPARCLNVRISTANVLTVLKQPQYPSSRPCNSTHGLIEFTKDGLRWRVRNTPWRIVALIFAPNVPRGKLARKGLNNVPRMCRERAPG